MLLGFTALAPSRLAAAVLILALSGVAGLAPRAHAAEHRCQCAARGVDGHHQCSCPICRLRSLRAAASDQDAPPCHRAAARTALGEELARAENGGAPRCSSRCDPSGALPGVSPDTELFTLPRLPALLRLVLAEEAGEVQGTPAQRESLPELPPPRAARS